MMQDLVAYENTVSENNILENMGGKDEVTKFSSILDETFGPKKLTEKELIANKEQLSEKETTAKKMKSGEKDDFLDLPSPYDEDTLEPDCFKPLPEPPKPDTVDGGKKLDWIKKGSGWSSSFDESSDELIHKGKKSILK